MGRRVRASAPRHEEDDDLEDADMEGDDLAEIE